MKKSKVFVALSLFASVALIGTSVSCSTPEDSRDPEIVSIYDSYVKNATENGETPLSYEEWLSSIKGEKGDKGDKGDTGETGPQGPQGEAGKDAPHAGETCTITFVLNGGTLPEGQATTLTVEYGSTVVLPIPTNAHASYFAGWFTGTSVNDGQFFNYSPVCSNLTLSARWAFTSEKLGNETVNIAPAKDVYYYGEAITVTPKEVANKTFSSLTFDVISGTSTFESY